MIYVFVVIGGLLFKFKFAYFFVDRAYCQSECWINFGLFFCVLFGFGDYFSVIFSVIFGYVPVNAS